MTELEEFRVYLCLAINSFVRDPADSPYQKGYEAALHECLVELDRIRNVTFSLTT